MLPFTFVCFVGFFYIKNIFQQILEFFKPLFTLACENGTISYLHLTSKLSLHDSSLLITLYFISFLTELVERKVQLQALNLLVLLLNPIHQETLKVCI